MHGYSTPLIHSYTHFMGTVHHLYTATPTSWVQYTTYPQLHTLHGYSTPLIHSYTHFMGTVHHLYTATLTSWVQYTTYTQLYTLYGLGRLSLLPSSCNNSSLVDMVVARGGHGPILGPTLALLIVVDFLWSQRSKCNNLALWPPTLALSWLPWLYPGPILTTVTFNKYYWLKAMMLILPPLWWAWRGTESWRFGSLLVRESQHTRPHPVGNDGHPRTTRCAPSELAADQWCRWVDTHALANVCVCVEGRGVSLCLEWVPSQRMLTAYC